MANLNKVMLIGRLTREPEARMFANGGKVVKFGFAVNNRKKNQQTGQWEEDPVFLDVEAFNRGEFGKNADLVEQYLHKGSQVFIEGHLKFEQWTSQEGQKRTAIKVVLDSMQFLDGKPADGNGGGRSYTPAQRPAPAPSAPSPSNDYDSGPPDDHGMDPGPQKQGEGDIPF